MGELIQVGMAECKLARPPDKLMTAGLGSCVGICLLDPITKIASMCHIMLPYCHHDKPAVNPGKYADTAILAAVGAMHRSGADTDHLIAKIAGGAQMFRFSGNSDIFKIGQRNVLSVEENLEKNKIQLLGKDIGGNVGRTIVFDPATGNLAIRTIHEGDKII
ncbi:MAG TPA: chemotaxis protein CheD [Syntrophomonas sp.]|jgi:chemotaxis protein CheD|nr:chemotaxis protein CheD [Syntrophomonas sp.]HRW11904.1 chemotaxis protein CheD [Syntrophomonas sp.]